MKPEQVGKERWIKETTTITTKRKYNTGNNIKRNGIVLKIERVASVWINPNTITNHYKYLKRFYALKCTEPTLTHTHTKLHYKSGFNFIFFRIVIFLSSVEWRFLFKFCFGIFSCLHSCTALHSICTFWVVSVSSSNLSAKKCNYCIFICHAIGLCNLCDVTFVCDKRIIYDVIMILSIENHTQTQWIFIWYGIILNLDMIIMIYLHMCCAHLR